MEKFKEYKNEFLKKGDYNVLLPDYSWAHEFDYSSALANIQLIAKQIVTVLQNIQDQTGITYDKFYVIGHSFGAQLAARIGAIFKVHRITGLDPARPGFPESLPSSERLDPSDAEIVDVWHCNAGACLPNFGLDYDAGHVNFYVNGGSIQTPCYTSALQSLLKGDLKIGLGSLLIPTVCFHIRCLEYYKVSINPEHCQFVGVQCNNYEDFVNGKCKSCGRSGQKCAIMGFDFEAFSPEQALRRRKKFKKYYVETDDICPYCKTDAVDLDGFKDLYESSLGSNNED
ncbi:pancreatic lipase-related protein 2-like isoform X2 [Stegodyphus dumicola]|uniref:pancreatic lipase-related protein 2-like isoform X2 n=1 Tax=Stegodyphus dumicola TaxID=202533 RepID=UPI0015B2D548|nr:pancreatic lipase-related protein 2-like isoform X2 [Stegodyphus dumicola]